MINITLLSTSIILAALVLGLLVFLIRGRKKNRILSPNSRYWSPELQASAVPTYKSTLSKLTTELGRMRRYNRPLTIVVLKIESDQLLIDMKRDLFPANGSGSVNSYDHIMRTIQLVFSLAGSLLGESLRESDIATYDVATNQYILVLPECDAAQAMQTVQRLKVLLFKRTAGHLVEGVAEFPKDGIIIEDLVAKAMESTYHKTNGKVENQAKVNDDGNGHSKIKELEELK